MPLTTTLVCPCLAACARNALDDVYESSLEFSMDVRRQEIAEYRRWMAEDERWKRGELGPNAARPTRPGLASDREIDALRMRLMERERIAFLGAKCADQATDCVLKELEQLGFSCTDATVASCTLLNTARGKYDTLHKHIRERHAWTVTVAPPPASPPIQAHVEIAPRRVDSRFARDCGNH